MSYEAAPPRILLRYRHAMRVLGLVDDEDAVQASDAVDLAQGVEHELLVALHILCIHLDEEVVIAAGVIALRNLVNALHHVHEFLDQPLRVLLQPDVAQHHDAVPHPVRVDDRHVPLDVTFPLQPLLPLEDRRRREVDTCSQFLHRQMGVLLQDFQNPAVCLVQTGCMLHFFHFLQNNILPD